MAKEKRSRKKKQEEEVFASFCKPSIIIINTMKIAMPEEVFLIYYYIPIRKSNL
jgi:hypothetical protein